MQSSQQIGRLHDHYVDRLQAEQDERDATGEAIAEEAASRADALIADPVALAEFLAATPDLEARVHEWLAEHFTAEVEAEWNDTEEAP